MIKIIDIYYNFLIIFVLFYICFMFYIFWILIYIFTFKLDCEPRFFFFIFYKNYKYL